MQGHFESWENRNDINFNQPNTNIASFTMASYNSPDNNSILDDSTPLPAILNHETSVRLNIPTMPVLMEYLLIQSLFMQQFVVRIMRVKIIFRYIILPMLECTTRK